MHSRTLHCLTVVFLFINNLCEVQLQEGLSRDEFQKILADLYPSEPTPTDLLAESSQNVGVVANEATHTSAHAPRNGPMRFFQDTAASVLSSSGEPITGLKFSNNVKSDRQGAYSERFSDGDPDQVAMSSEAISNGFETIDAENAENEASARSNEIESDGKPISDQFEGESESLTPDYHQLTQDHLSFNEDDQVFPIKPINSDEIKANIQQTYADTLDEPNSLAATQMSDFDHQPSFALHFKQDEILESRNLAQDAENENERSADLVNSDLANGDGFSDRSLNEELPTPDALISNNAEASGTETELAEALKPQNGNFAGRRRRLRPGADTRRRVRMRVRKVARNDSALSERNGLPEPISAEDFSPTTADPFGRFPNWNNTIRSRPLMLPRPSPPTVLPEGPPALEARSSPYPSVIFSESPGPQIERPLNSFSEKVNTFYIPSQVYTSTPAPLTERPSAGILNSTNQTADGLHAAASETNTVHDDEHVKDRVSWEKNYMNLQQNSFYRASPEVASDEETLISKNRNKTRKVQETLEGSAQSPAAVLESGEDEHGHRSDVTDHRGSDTVDPTADHGMPSFEVVDIGVPHTVPAVENLDPKDQFTAGSDRSGEIDQSEETHGIQMGDVNENNFRQDPYIPEDQAKSSVSNTQIQRYPTFNRNQYDRSRYNAAQHSSERSDDRQATNAHAQDQDDGNAYGDANSGTQTNYNVNTVNQNEHYANQQSTREEAPPRRTEITTLAPVPPVQPNWNSEKFLGFGADKHLSPDTIHKGLLPESELFHGHGPTDTAAHEKPPHSHEEITINLNHLPPSTYPYSNGHSFPPSFRDHNLQQTAQFSNDLNKPGDAVGKDAKDPNGFSPPFQIQRMSYPGPPEHSAFNQSPPPSHTFQNPANFQNGFLPSANQNHAQTPGNYQTAPGRSSANQFPPGHPLANQMAQGHSSANQMPQGHSSANQNPSGHLSANQNPSAHASANQIPYGFPAANQMPYEPPGANQIFQHLPEANQNLRYGVPYQSRTGSVVDPNQHHPYTFPRFPQPAYPISPYEHHQQPMKSLHLNHGGNAVQSDSFQQPYQYNDLRNPAQSYQDLENAFYNNMEHSAKNSAPPPLPRRQGAEPSARSNYAYSPYAGGNQHFNNFRDFSDSSAIPKNNYKSAQESTPVLTLPMPGLVSIPTPPPEAHALNSVYSNRHYPPHTHSISVKPDYEPANPPLLKGHPLQYHFDPFLQNAGDFPEEKSKAQAPPTAFVIPIQLAVAPAHHSPQQSYNAAAQQQQSFIASQQRPQQSNIASQQRLQQSNIASQQRPQQSSIVSQQQAQQYIASQPPAGYDSSDSSSGEPEVRPKNNRNRDRSRKERQRKPPPKKPAEEPPSKLKATYKMAEEILGKFSSRKGRKRTEGSKLSPNELQSRQNGESLEPKPGADMLKLTVPPNEPVDYRPIFSDHAYVLMFPNMVPESAMIPAKPFINGKNIMVLSASDPSFYEKALTTGAPSPGYVSASVHPREQMLQVLASNHYDHEMEKYIERKRQPPLPIHTPYGLLVPMGLPKFGASGGGGGSGPSGGSAPLDGSTSYNGFAPTGGSTSYSSSYPTDGSNPYGGSVSYGGSGSSVDSAPNAGPVTYSDTLSPVTYSGPYPASDSGGGSISYSSSIPSVSYTSSTPFGGTSSQNQQHRGHRQRSKSRSKKPKNQSNEYGDQHSSSSGSREDYADRQGSADSDVHIADDEVTIEVYDHPGGFLPTAVAHYTIPPKQQGSYSEHKPVKSHFSGRTISADSDEGRTGRGRNGTKSKTRKGRKNEGELKSLVKNLLKERLEELLDDAELDDSKSKEKPLPPPPKQVEIIHRSPQSSNSTPPQRNNYPKFLPPPPRLTQILPMEQLQQPPPRPSLPPPHDESSGIFQSIRRFFTFGRHGDPPRMHPQFPHAGGQNSSVARGGTGQLPPHGGANPYVMNNGFFKRHNRPEPTFKPPSNTLNIDSIEHHSEKLKHGHGAPPPKRSRRPLKQLLKNLFNRSNNKRGRVDNGDDSAEHGPRPTTRGPLYKNSSSPRRPFQPSRSLEETDWTPLHYNPVQRRSEEAEDQLQQETQSAGTYSTHTAFFPFPATPPPFPEFMSNGHGGAGHGGSSMDFKPHQEFLSTTQNDEYFNLNNQGQKYMYSNDENDVSSR